MAAETFPRYAIVTWPGAGIPYIQETVFTDLATATSVRDQWQASADEAHAPVLHQVFELREIGR